MADMRKLSGIFISISLFLLMICVLSPNIWTACEYCKEYTGSFQTCTSSNNCSRYYTFRSSACCTSQNTGEGCDRLEYSASTIWYYQLTSGSSCSGTNYCSGNATPCSQDFLVATSSNCVPYGPQYAISNPKYICN